MGQTTGQIRDEIESQRNELGDNLHQLESKMRETVDWRHHFEQRPMTMIGAAFAGGIALGMLSGGGSEHKQERKQTGYTMASYDAGQQTWDDGKPRRDAQTKRRAPEMNEIQETFDNMRGALLGLAASRARSFLAEMVPGFEREYNEAASKRGASRESSRIERDYRARERQSPATSAADLRNDERGGWRPETGVTPSTETPMPSYEGQPGTGMTPSTMSPGPEPENRGAYRPSS